MFRRLLRKSIIIHTSSAIMATPAMAPMTGPAIHALLLLSDEEDDDDVEPAPESLVTVGSGSRVAEVAMSAVEEDEDALLPLLESLLVAVDSVD